MRPEFIDGVLSQPDNLVGSAATVRAALADGKALDLLGRGRLAAIGMGASTHAVTGFAAALRALGRPVLAFSAADGVAPGLADAYLGVSQSGRSRETVEALRAVGPGAARVGLTNRPDQPLGAEADAVLPLGIGEDTRVSTLSYTATVQALGLIADALTGAASADWDTLPEVAAGVLSADVGEIAEAFDGVSVIDVVGSGIRAASVGAAALLIREAVHLPTAGYTTREYLHGPLEAAGEGRAALVFGTGRELQLAADLAGWGARVVLVTAAEPPSHPDLRVVRVPAPGGLADAVLDILPVQLTVARLAERRGITIDLHHMPDDTKVGAA